MEEKNFLQPKEGKKTHADTHLVDVFRNMFMYHKGDLNRKLSETEIATSFYTALSGLSTFYSSCEFILAVKKDFEIIMKQVEHFARTAQRDITSSGSRRVNDKYSETDVYYTVPEIQTRWNVSGEAVRKAIRENRLNYKEVSGRKSKYRVLKEDFEDYAHKNNIPLRHKG